MTNRLCFALAGIMVAAMPCHAQSQKEQTSAMVDRKENGDVKLRQNSTTNATDNPGHTNSGGNQPVATGVAATDAWRPVQTKDVSVANSAQVLLPYFNKGPVFGLPGTDVGNFWHRTQLSGDWGGIRTKLARRGFFFDLYSTGAYQDVVSAASKPEAPSSKTFTSPSM